MPLPSALAARLAKRGIIVKPKKQQSKTANDDIEEEVFAEDYDEPDTAAIPTPDNTTTVTSGAPDPSAILQAEVHVFRDDGEESILVHESLACPNRKNEYHECSDFCKDRWGFKKFKSDPETDRKRFKMLKKYPLPQGWDEVGDPETGRFYYWNSDTDEVSWLPPAHPRCTVSLPADRIKELFENANKPVEKESSSSSSEDEEGDIMDIDDFEEIERKILMEKRNKDEKQNRKEKKRGREEPLDPMDPASYSDIPRGTWSTGLDKRGSAKTGVDSSASGPLFQMRPYPSPGAILRMNKDIGDDKK